MKLSVLFLLLGILQLHAECLLAQNSLINLNMHNVKIDDVFKSIEKQSSYEFFYNNKQIDVNKLVSVDVKNAKISDVVTKLLKSDNLTYKLIGKRLVLVERNSYENQLLDALIETQQQKKISGTVADPNGQTIVGATVSLKGTAKAVITDTKGNFSIDVTDKNATLVFSFVGYETQEYKIAGESTVNIVLQPSIKSLGEVVVVGYGTQKRREVTSAISTIDVSTTKDITASNVTRLLEGGASGITVKQTTGAPGQEFEVTIRGLGSLGAGSQPLYVVDGFPIGTSVGQNFNPNDIATISILKDAVSTAIYGARGSNGVVLITTKNAKAGENNISFMASYGIQNVPNNRKIKVLNGVEFAQFQKDIFMDKIRYFQNREPSINEVPLDFRYPEQTKTSTNWFDAILHKNAPTQNYNVTLSNGKGDIHSLVSVGYIGQEGALIYTNYKDYSVRANVEGKVNNFINMGLNINGSYSTQNQASTEGRGEIVGSTLLMDPRDPIYNADGSFKETIGSKPGIFGFPNPVLRLKELKMNRQISDVLSNGFLEFSLLKNFKFKSAGNARFNYSTYKQFIPSFITDGYPALRDAYEYDDAYRTMNLSTDQLLTYSNAFGDHHLNILLGFTAQEEIVKGLAGTGIQFPNDQTPFLNQATIKSSGSTEYGWGMDAYFTRINYSFKDKYLFSGTLRREGNSRFGSKNKYGNFPAASVGWRISDEPFMAKFSWLNDLKVRSSFGITGNNNIGNYSSLAFMNTSNYILGNNLVNGMVASSITNADLGWEKSNQLDVGLDLSAFKNQLTFTVDYYNKITSDMLLPMQIPSISGFTSTLTNIGKVQNNGIEFATSFKTKINAIGIHSNFNISFNRNKVLAIRGVNDEIWNGSMYADYNVSKIGQPIGMIYGFKVLGIFQNQAEIDKSPKQDGAIPGSYKYYDATGDGIISYDTKDMVAIGNPWPKATWGFTLGGDYKNFDLNILLTGAQGYDISNQIEKSGMDMDGIFNVFAESKDRWRSEQNPGNGIVQGTNTWKWSRETSSRYIYSGSHMWIKNISLGYTLPKLKSHCAVRVYLNADNLLLFTKYPGNNPDVNQLGGTQPGQDDASYPVPRNFTIGTKITF